MGGLFLILLCRPQVYQLVAPAKHTVDTVNAWLKENGIFARPTSAAGDALSFELPVDKANELFDADFSVFKHDEPALKPFALSRTRFRPSSRAIWTSSTLR